MQLRKSNPFGHRRFKYHNKVTSNRLGKFQSKREAKHALIFEDLHPQMQVSFELIPKQAYAGANIRACHYVADFVIERNGHTYIVDTKGMIMDVFKLKAKLMLRLGKPILVVKSDKSALVVKSLIMEGKTPEQIYALTQ